MLYGLLHFFLTVGLQADSRPWLADKRSEIEALSALLLSQGIRVKPNQLVFDRSIKRQSASSLMAYGLPQATVDHRTKQSLYRFPVELQEVASEHLALENCSFLDMQVGELGHDILRSKLFRESLARPLSSIELGRRTTSEKLHTLRIRVEKMFHLEADDDDEDDESAYEAVAGLGFHEFEWKGEPIYLMRYIEILPQASGDERDERMTIFVHGQGRAEHLLEFVNSKEFRPDVIDDEVEVLMYNANKDYPEWRQTNPVAARRLATVLLPANIKDSIDNDIQDFLSVGRMAFFREHGIPYKRSYLFYGVPGAGKSSLIRALASKYKRKICILQPSGPGWDDFKLAKAVQDAPARAMIVVEDVDTLFSESRLNTASSTTTFSGLLNVLDGVNVKDGCIFVLTTNFRERLDEALIREGRIDFQVPFDYILPAEVMDMFKQFYPGEEDTDKPKLFEAALSKELGSERYGKLSPAALQLYFVKQYGKAADEAIENVGMISKLKDVRESTTAPGFGFGTTNSDTASNIEHIM